MSEVDSFVRKAYQELQERWEKERQSEELMSPSEERVRQAKERLEKSVREAREEIERYASDPEKQELVRRRRRFIIDYNLSISAARKEGRAKSQTTVAQNMKREGYPSEKISEMTGLSKDEIAGLE